MRVTIVGTGNMARGVAARALAGGHHVTFVGTDVGKAEDLADEMTGEGPVEASERIEADVVVLAVPYTQAPHVVRDYADQLDGAVVVDVTNPVDISVLEPLRADYVEPFDSGAQLIAAGGMRPIDAGSLARARELEALGYLHMAIQPALGTAFASALKVLA